MKLIIGNWKMYPKEAKKAKRIWGELKKNSSSPKAKVVICPPMPYLGAFLSSPGVFRIAVGAQDVFGEDEGARTGEVSPAMVKSLGAQYVILGHSERRALGETDKEVAQKAKAAVRNKLKVILCIGEKERDHGGAYYREVGDQLRASLSRFPKNAAKSLVVAYEPVWAIGIHAKGVATPESFHEMSIYVRRHLVDYFGKKSGFSIPILYGGSVDDKNAPGFLNEGGAQGFLVGRASLDPRKFSAIVRLASQ